MARLLPKLDCHVSAALDGVMMARFYYLRKWTQAHREALQDCCEALYEEAYQLHLKQKPNAPRD